MERRSLTSFLTLIVSGIWIVSAIDAVAFNRLIPFEVATPVMFAVVGFYFTKREG